MPSSYDASHTEKDSDIEFKKHVIDDLKKCNAGLVKKLITSQSIIVTLKAEIKELKKKFAGKINPQDAGYFLTEWNKELGKRLMESEKTIDALQKIICAQDKVILNQAERLGVQAKEIKELNATFKSSVSSAKSALLVSELYLRTNNGVVSQNG